MTLEIVDVENNGKLLFILITMIVHRRSLSVIFLKWSLIFYGTESNPSHQLATSTPSKVVAANVHLHPSDEINTNIARSRSTNHHNSFHTRHREKNRKNKQQNHYYIKHHYYPYEPVSSSSATSYYTDDQYLLDMSKSHRTQPYLTFILLIVVLIWHSV